MDVNDAEDYDKVKEAVLAKYEITADTYRRRFGALDIHQDETLELYIRLKDLFNKWVRPETSSVKDICGLLILEQFLRMVDPDLEVWIRERDPKSAENAARLAEVFLLARYGSRRPTFSRDKFHSIRSPMGMKGVVNRSLDFSQVANSSPAVDTLTKNHTPHQSRIHTVTNAIS